MPYSDFYEEYYTLEQHYGECWRVYDVGKNPDSEVQSACKSGPKAIMDSNACNIQLRDSRSADAKSISQNTTHKTGGNIVSESCPDDDITKPTILNQEEHKCIKCDKLFICNTRFFSHVKRGCVGRRTYPCEKCNYEFYQKCHLIRHQKTYPHCYNKVGYEKCKCCHKYVKKIRSHIQNYCKKFRDRVTDLVKNHKLEEKFYQTKMNSDNTYVGLTTKHSMKIYENFCKLEN